MHERVRLLEELPTLRAPVLLAAFVGWTDTHGTAAAAVNYLAEQWAAQPFAEIDPEPFYDFTVQRPITRNRAEGRVLLWPTNRFMVASPPGLDHDFVLFSGIEPHLRWQTFLDAMVEVLEAVGSTTSVTIGAQPGAVPHTRPLPVTLSASDKGFEEQFGLKIPTSRYEGPTGLMSVLNLRLRELGWRNASIWALLPHYLNAGPNPNAIRSLVRTIDRGFSTSTGADGLEERISAFDAQVQEALDPSSEAAEYVRSLEEQYDASGNNQFNDEGPGRGGPPAELPTSEEILGDLERFLREQRDDP